MVVLVFLFRLFAAGLSRLPFRLLYLFSDVLYLKAYYLFRYRRKLVFRNLRHAFPEKSQQEIEEIARRYYRNMCDIFVEFVKIERLAPADFQERVTFVNPQLLEDLWRSGRSALLVTGHLGNWEWLGIAALPLLTPFTRTYALSRQLSNAPFDRYVLAIRQWFGSTMLVDQNPLKSALATGDEQFLLVIYGDQVPTYGQIRYWTDFLNQDTAWFTSAEWVGRGLDCPVVFLDMQRTGRGRYEIESTMLADAPRAMAEFEITEQYVRQLEAAIRRQPDNWLWGHRRWKRTRSAAGQPSS